MQTSVVMHLDTSFEHVRQDPGFKRRLLWDISAALRVPQRFIKVAAVEEDQDGSRVAVHLVLQDSDKILQGTSSSSKRPHTDGMSPLKSPSHSFRSAEDLATELWRQSRLPDSNLRLGSCSGQVSLVEIQGDVGGKNSRGDLAGRGEHSSATTHMAAHEPAAIDGTPRIDAARSLALSPHVRVHVCVSLRLPVCISLCLRLGLRRSGL